MVANPHTRPVREKVTNAVAVWFAGDCRPINIVVDGGLTEVIRIASGDNSYDLPSRGTIVSRIHSLYDGERAQKKISSSSKLPALPLLVTTGRQSAITITWVSSLFENTALCVVFCLKKIQLNKCLKYTLSESDFRK